MPKPGATSRDFPQVLKESYDPSLERLRVDALITDGTDAMLVNADGSINTAVTSSALPTGAATEVKQDTGNTSLDNIDTSTSSIDSKLSTFTASQYNQTVGNTYLSNISNNSEPPSASGTAGTINGEAVTTSVSSVNGYSTISIIPSGTWSGLIALQGSVDGTTYQLIPVFEYAARTAQLYISTNDIYTAAIGGFRYIRCIGIAGWSSGTATITSYKGNGLSTLPVISNSPTQFYGTMNLRDGSSSAVNKGQTNMAGSLPVVLPTDQSAIPASQSGTWNINDISGTVSLPTGASTAANQTTANTSLSNIDTKTPEFIYQTSGSLSAAGQDTCELACNGFSTVSVRPSGAWGGLIQVQGSVNGTDWQLLPIYEYGTRTSQLFISTNDNAVAQIGGFERVRLYATSMSGTATLDLSITNGNSPAQVVNPDPAALYGTVNIRDGNNSAFIKGETTMSSSLPVVIASDQSPVANKSYKAYDSNNTSTTPLSGGATFTGTSTDTTNYNNVSVQVYSDVASATDGLVLEFSGDGTNWDTDDKYTVPAASGELFTASLPMRYFRVRYTNGASAQSTFRLYTTLHANNIKPSSHRISDDLDTENDAELVKAVLAGVTDGGVYKNVPADGNGHLEVAIHGPLNPFGSIHTEFLQPIVQHDAVYGLDTQLQVAYTTFSGAVTAADSAFKVSTGTTQYGSGTLQSKDRVRYHPGQGIVARFTYKFSSFTSGYYQIAGLGHPEDGVYFGYVGDGSSSEFGILYVNRGVRETQTLTVSTASTTAENITITLNSVAFTDVAVTNSGSTARTAYEIGSYDYDGWVADVVGSTVIFTATSVGDKTGTFSLSSATTAAGSFAETKTGSAATETFIPQSTWNGDKLDGTGPSGVTLDPTKFNVYQMKLQYLGAGAITFEVEAAPAGNNPTWVPVHSIQRPNNFTQTTFGNPSFPFTFSAYSYSGSGTDVTGECGSYAGFQEGIQIARGNNYTYYAQKASIDAGSYFALFTIKNAYYYKGVANQSVINLLNIRAACKHNNPVTIYMIKNATLVGTPSFSSYATNSCSLYDSSASTCTFTDNDQLIWSGGLGETGNLGAILENINLQPGDSVTLAARTVFGTANYVTISLNTREDQ